MLKICIATSLLFHIGLGTDTILTLKKGKNMVEYKKNLEGAQSFEKIEDLSDWGTKRIFELKNNEIDNVCPPTHPFLCTFQFTDEDQENGFSGCIEKDIAQGYFPDLKKQLKATCCYRRFLAEKEQEIWSKNSCLFKRWIKLRQKIRNSKNMKSWREKYGKNNCMRALYVLGLVIIPIGPIIYWLVIPFTPSDSTKHLNSVIPLTIFSFFGHL